MSKRRTPPVPVDQVKQDILRYLRTESKPTSITQMKTALHYKKTQVQRACTQLRRAGLIQSIYGEIHPGQRPHLYTLPNSEPSHPLPLPTSNSQGKGTDKAAAPNTKATENGAYPGWSNCAKAFDFVNQARELIGGEIEFYVEKDGNFTLKYECSSQ